MFKFRVLKFQVYTCRLTSFISPNRPETKSLEKVEIEKPINGIVDVELNPVAQLSLTSNRDYDLDLELTAVVTETLTKKNFSSTSYLNMVEDNVKMEVLNGDEQLKPGLPFEFQVKVVNRNDEPVVDTQNKVKLGYSFQLKDSANDSFIEKEYEIQNGLLERHVLDVPKNTTDLYIRATYKGRKYSVHHYSASSSKNDHFIQLNVLNKPNNKNVYKTGDKVEFEIRTTQPISNYTLMVVKQSNIVSANYKLKEPSTSEKLSIDVDHKLAPNFKVIVFYLTNENQIIGDQRTIEVSDLFRTPIDLQSSTNQTQPGEKVDITVKTR